MQIPHDEYILLKEQIKKEVIAEVKADSMPQLKYPIWNKAYKHLQQEMLTITELHNYDYWRLFESIRAVIKFTFGLDRVTSLPERQYGSAIKLIDDIVASVKKAREYITRKDD